MFVARGGGGVALFSGDAIFCGGCGRFFEGTAKEMLNGAFWALRRLPSEAFVFPGHEYTVANLEFACWAEPSNARAAARLEEARRARGERRATVPSTVRDELESNPFVRCVEFADQRYLLREGLSAPLDSATTILANLRALKDANAHLRQRD
jgi:hydroxyacylglutathione hydrolase